MKKRSWRARFADIAVMTALGVLIAFLVAYPSESVAAAAESLSMCVTVIVPSLFIFFAVSSLAVKLGAAEKLGRALERLMRPLFRVNGSCAIALALGLLGGYPVGTKTAVALYEDGMCTKDEAERLLGFCNNSGPAFILGVVGASVFGNPVTGLILLGIHAAAAVVTGIIFGLTAKDRGTEQILRQKNMTPGFAEAFTMSISSGVSSSLSVCGYVIFFAVLLKILDVSGVLPAMSAALSSLLGPIGVTPSWARRIITGVFEISGGVVGITPAASPLAAPVAAFILGWGGLSVHCQSLSYICATDLRASKYFIDKLLHGLLSAAAAFLVFRSGVSPAAAVGGGGESDIWLPIAAVGAYAALVVASLVFFAIKKRVSARRQKPETLSDRKDM